MSELYEKIARLCANAGINITELCRQSGASRGSLTDLKKGRKQSLSADTLSKIAAYFGVSVDYLLGNEEKEKPATPAGDEHDILDDVDVAFYGDYKELTEDEKEILRDMVRAMRERRQKKQEE